jgi:hypothetical protein
VREGTAFICLSIATRAHGNESSGFIKVGEYLTKLSVINFSRRLYFVDLITLLFKFVKI